MRAYKVPELAVTVEQIPRNAMTKVDHAAIAGRITSGIVVRPATQQ